MKVNLIVNGCHQVAEIDKGMSLLAYLRDELGLMGVKNGCGEGHCGACTVIVDGVARRSCVTRMDRLEGSAIVTIEGLSTGDTLHPIQRAFIEEGAIQCGFCTPGMILAAKALLDKIPDPSDADIRKALKYNVCRCTGYAAIVRAVRRASQLLQRPPLGAQVPVRARVVGASIPRKDAHAKATGQPIYTDDIRMEGMLFGKILYSPMAHARVKSLNVLAARQLPGVAAVLTARDIPGDKHYGLIKQDQPVLVTDYVRCVSDALAVAFAETREAAEQAVKAVEVELESLPIIETPRQALDPSTPALHQGGNVLAHVKVRKGDVQAGFTAADTIVEGTYRVPFIEHAYLEPESAVARVDEEGVISVWCGSQGPEIDRVQIAASLGVSTDRVRVIHQTMGGAFGGKEDITVQILAALGALKTGRPVKITLNRQESLRASVKRHAMELKYRTGALRDGRLVAVEAEILADTGAYASVGSPVAFRAASFACGPYVVPNVKVDVYAVHTNNITCGAMRGFGNPQPTFAAELQMDALAQALGIDPWEFRYNNALDVGDTTATGHRLEASIGIRPALVALKEEVAHLVMPQPQPGKKLGVGIACSYKNVGLGGGIPEGVGAWVGLDAEGYLEVHVGCVDMGQGSDTTMALIAAQVLEFPFERIRVFSGDSFRDPSGGMTTASRQTFMSGNAVLHASREFLRKIKSFALRAFDANPDEFVFGSQSVMLRSSGGQVCTLQEIAALAASQGIALIGEYQYVPPETHGNLEVPTDGSYDPVQHKLHVAYCFACQAALVEVDEQSGDTRVLKVIAAQDAGKAINPQAIVGQMEGGIVMGLGYALSEEFSLSNGVPLTDSLRKCGVPTVDEMPEMVCRIIENPHPDGPLGAKGMGELPMSPTAPAVVNAIARATGIRIRELPATPAKLQQAKRDR